MKPSPAVARAFLCALVAVAAVLGVPAAALADDPEHANFDARPDGDGTAPAAVERAADRLRERLGRFAALSLDDRTGTLRSVGRLDGFLTGPSGRDGDDVALDYVRDNATAFGLDGDDVSGLRLVDREFVAGVERLSWEQRFRGVPAVDAGLEAAVTGSGRLVALTGPPAADLAVRSVEPAVDARRAYAAARESAGASGAAPIESAGSGPEQTTSFADGGRASLALYHGASGYRLAWRVLAPVSSSGVYDVLVDARSAKVVRRANLTDFADAKVYRHSPVHPEGPKIVPLDPWLDASGNLSGPNAHAFADVRDAVGFAAGRWNLEPSGGNVAPGVHNLLPPDDTSGCQDPDDAAIESRCTWDPDAADSWERNRAQSVNQLFYLVNNFHDHLESDPDIKFTEGSFERTGQPLGDPNLKANAANSDPVLAQALNGADGDGGGLPDEDHVNNASFTTLPDGLPGLMEIHLWQPPLFGAYDGANDATLVYHEYTHGLSNRLVTDLQGFGALNTAQAGALGEGWSDFYAIDYLDEEGLEIDQPGAIDVFVGGYLDNRTAPLFRWQGLDCTPTTACVNPSGPADGNGFTYADFGRVQNVPEVHSDGEIWAQTLWSIRNALIAAYTERLGDDPVAGRAAGIAQTRKYVTEGMRNAPAEPSFIDARNAILMASTLEEDDEVMWKVFADRGMGYFAGSDGSEDTTPKADFTDTNEFDGIGTISGTVRDENGVALGGAEVGIAGFDTGLGLHKDVTRSDGTYVLDDVPTLAGSNYPVLRARKGAFKEVHARNVEVARDPAVTTRDFVLPRDFSSAVPAPTAAKVASFTGPNNTASGCGPGGLIDDDPATVWGTDTNNGNGREIVVELAAPVDLGAVSIDPGAGCGDDETAALRGYDVLVARTPDGPFDLIASGQFLPSEINGPKEVYRSDSGVLGVRYIKLRAKTSQDPSPGEDGEDFIDVAELHVERTPGSATGIAANTGAATGIGHDGATLTGTANPHGSAAEVWFDYGTTPSYGSRVSAGNVSGGHAAAPVTAPIGGLQPSTRYYFRLVARRNGREYHGGQGTFVTAAAPQPPPSNPPPSTPPPSSPPPSNPAPVVRPTLLLDTKLSARRKGTFKVRVFFGDAAPAGSARISVIGPKRRLYARAYAQVRIGGNVVKTLMLNRKGRRAIKPGKSKRITLELRLPNGQKIKKSLRLARSRR